MEMQSIPSYMPEVFVFGEVMNPGAIPYQELLRADEYISLAGRCRVSDERVIVISPDGRASMLNWFFKFIKETIYYPGSVVYVPSMLAR